MREKNIITTPFLDIVKHHFGQKFHTLLCIVKLLRVIIAELSLKNAWLPPIFVLNFNSPC